MGRLPDRDYEGNAAILHALAHATRLKILCAIRGTERAVGEIEELTAISQPRLSQQLAILRKAKLVQTRREGKQVLYRVNEPRLRGVADMLNALAGTPGDVPARSRASLNAPSGAARFARITR